MASKLHFFNFFLPAGVVVLLEIRANEDLDHFVIRSCSYKSRLSAPVNAVDRTIVVVNLFVDHFKKVSRVIVIRLLSSKKSLTHPEEL